MKICALSVSLAKSFEALGHEVLAITPPGESTLLDLPRVLATQNFSPDLVFQEEFLGNRTILQGLEQLSCPKIFWSLDTHLNLFWQSHYFRLFDGVMTPHTHLLQQLKLQAPPVARLARFGYELPWNPHAQRPYQVAFVGRFTKYRPMRTWLARFLEETYQAAIFKDVPFPQMLELYLQTRLAPNEAIAAEVNFRLLETASCGCLVFSQNTGPDQDALFTPGREIQTYDDAAELKELIDFFIKHPELAERKGRAAWERIRAEHLAVHRAQAVLDFAAGLTTSSASAHEARTALWLTLWAMRKGGRNTIPLPEVEKALEQLPPCAEVHAARLCIKATCKDREGFLRHAVPLLAETLYPADLECNLAGSLGALLLDEWDLAKQFWYRHWQAQSLQAGRRPENPAALCLLWAASLRRANVLLLPGLSYPPGEHVPCSALECLYLALSYEPDNLEAVRRIEELFSQIKGNDYFRMGYLSKLSLQDTANWRLNATLGVLNLRTFRLRQGLEELALAHALARRQGRENGFFRALARMDQRGYIKRALAEYQEDPAAPDAFPQTTNNAE